MTTKLSPIHPGVVLRRDFLEPMGISIAQLARELCVPHQHLGRIIRGERGISGDVALRLARFFGTSAQLWMGLQARHDLDTAEDKAGREIEKQVKPWRAA